MPQYRKKSEAVEAVQVCWANLDRLLSLLGYDSTRQMPSSVGVDYVDKVGEPGPFLCISVPVTHEAAIHGQWVVKSGDKFEVLNPLEFRIRYEEVVPQPTAFILDTSKIRISEPSVISPLTVSGGKVLADSPLMFNKGQFGGAEGGDS